MATEKLWLINGSYQSYSELHENYGYTETATIPVTFKDAATGTWGDDSGVSGYSTNAAPGLAEYYCIGLAGWRNLTDLVDIGYMPSDTDASLAFTNGLLESPGAKLLVSAPGAVPEAYRYLVLYDIESGWMDDATLAEHGWSEVQPVQNQTMFSIMDSSGESDLIEFDDSYNEIMEPYTP